MTNERRRRRWHWLACLVVAWSLVFLSIALCEAEQITSASPSGSQHHHHSDCHSLRPRLTVQKHLLPATHLDSRDRSVTVVVEWQLDVFLPDERGAWEECRYVVRVTDSVPGLPLRVPNELAHLFATTHNNSYVHREYPITFNTDASSSSSIMQRDSWNYTLLIQPVSLSPLNDSLRLALPSPQLTLLAAHADDTEARKVIDSAAPDSPTVLTLSLYYAPASVSLYDALGLSLACMAAILVCHFLTAGRLDKAVRMREERVKQKKALAATHAAEQSSPPTAAPVDTTAPAASAAQRSVVRDNLAVGGSATPAPPDDASSSSPSSPTPYRFKAKDTRKRFTRPQPSGGSMDF